MSSSPLVMATSQQAPAAAQLLSAAAVRERAHEVLQEGLADRLAHFRLNPDRLMVTARFVAEVIRENYPSLKVPIHARWRHFCMCGRDLWAEMESRVAWRTSGDRARAAFDLTIISVLLDAGTGPDWTYRDEETGLTAARSEGLALATLRMFGAGLFSSDPHSPLRADGTRLASLSLADLAEGFQSHSGNALAGLDGRLQLLLRLGDAVLQNSKVFANAGAGHPGDLFDHLSGLASGKKLPATAILGAVLTHLAPIWPGRICLGGISLGDTWRHPVIKRSDLSDGLLPLHKLSQWLSYSLVEPLTHAGITVTDIDELTGLAEYRNGGLFLDLGVLELRDPGEAFHALPVDSELIVEWRGLTVALLDLLAPRVRDELGLSAKAFPLGSMLEGGTWSAGRKIARQKRSDGRPPLTVISDGTVF
ncbi:MAG: DUF1688 family protein [Rhodomicrobium sp.]